MEGSKALSGDKRGERVVAEAFVRKMYGLRVLGLGLGSICVGGGLWQAGAPLWEWLLLAGNAVAWAHVAYWLAQRSPDPRRAELRNLTIDSAFGGAWIAAIGFNLVPSAVLVGMLAMDKAAVGGLRFLARCLNAQVAAAAAVALIEGFEMHLESGLVAILASLPMLLAYPVTVGYTAYGFLRRARLENDLLRNARRLNEGG